MVALILLIVSPSYSEDNGSPFRTKEDLKSYMKHLHEQFGIVGRPRFGKRITNFDRFDDFSGYVLNTYQLFTGHEEKIICQNIDMKDTFQKINIKNYSFDIYVYNSNAEDNN
jgi:hypothetical protein